MPWKNRLLVLAMLLLFAEAPRAEDGTTSGAKPAGRVAILRDDLPSSPATASPDDLSQILQRAGMETTLMNCSEFGNSNTFNHDRFDVVILPYGPSFPLKAADNFRQFLREGGKFFSTGGYAFDHLLERTTNGWQQPKPPALPDVSQVLWRYRIPAEEIRGRGKLTFSGFLKAQNIRGSGMAYFAVYQYAADGRITDWQDICKVRGSQDWKEFQHSFQVQAQSKTVELHAGLFQCRGVAWFDDLALTDGNGDKILNSDMEAEFDPDKQAGKQWQPSDKTLCELQDRVRHSGQRALMTTLHYALPPEERLNTRHGLPEDGLTVEPTQLGVFDADYLLERARSARAASEQSVVPPDLRVEGDLAGYAACGVAGFEHARWIPLLNAYDRYGRLRGAAGALLRHYAGPYAGSSWAFFGVTNRNLFAASQPGMDGALVRVVRSLVRDTYVESLTSDLACYRQGESVKLSVPVFNGGRTGRSLRLTVRIYEREPLGLDEPPIERLLAELKTNFTVAAGQSASIAMEWKPGQFRSDFYYLLGQLWEGEEEIDRIQGGFLVWNEETMAAGPKLSFRDNYLRLGKRPMFLFGTDDWAYVFNTKRETPLQWLRDMRLRRDLGVQIYENLQFGALPPFTATNASPRREQTLRKVDGLVQLSQKYGQVYFAGLLVGQNTAASERELVAQTAWCADFAKRYAGVPGLIHYFNGDLRCQITEGVTPQWNEFLRERYGATEKLRAAWGKRSPNEELGKIRAEDFNDWGQAWDDVKVHDLNDFRAWLIRHWHTNLIAGVREFDKTHPTSSEFYQLPHSGVDIPAAIGELDLCNFGYFDKPGADLARFPAICKYNDQRARGKSFGPGEYGVKTHPAWGDGKDYGYHITRTREQAIELFLGIAHYTLGLGGSRIHNWCWKDSAHHVFPWGMIYPGDGVPKDIAYLHRNQSLLFRHFAPVYREPKVYLLTADGHRLGGGKWQVIEGILAGFDLALATHVENLGTLNEQGLQIPKSAQVIFWPLPFCPTDETYAKVLAWVRQGGVLYLSGDISYDELRQRTRTNRLEELCGVRFVAENFPNIRVGATNAAAEPCIRVEASTARVLELAKDGAPMLLENSVGQGKVIFTTDPVELHSVAARHDKDLALYRRVLEAGGIKPLGLEPNDPRIHLFRQPLQDGGQVYVLFNTDESQPARTVILTDFRPPVTLTVARQRPALLWFDGQGALRAVETQGDGSVGGKLLIKDETGGIAMSLDAQDLRRSQALLLMPLRAGTIRLATERQWRNAALHTGEVRDGRWWNYETAPVRLSDSGLVINIMPDQVFSLLLVTESETARDWSQTVERAMNDPASLP
ncbi:MAG: hypothetical protein AAB676_01675 [Verrucomicrobiota bacterium]